MLVALVCTFVMLAFAAVPQVDVLATGLNAPRKIAYADGRLYVTEGGAAGAVLTQTGSITEIRLDGASSSSSSSSSSESSSSSSSYSAVRGVSKRIVTGLDSLPDGATANGPSGITVVDGKLFFVNSGAVASQLATALPVDVASHSRTLGQLLGFNLEHSSSSSSDSGVPVSRLHGLGDVGSFSLASQYALRRIQGPAAPVGDSNPYSVVYDSSSATFYVADAAANQIVAVKDGLMRNVAFFPPTCAGATQGNGDAVTTSVTIGPDGFLYVGTLELLQFFNPGNNLCTPATMGPIKGRSNIYRIDPSKTGYTVTAADIFAGGFTTITDLHYDSHTQSLYVVELFANDVVRVQLKADHHVVVAGPRTVLGAGALSSPNGVTTDDKGNVYVTDCTVGAPGCVQRVVRVNF